MLIPASKMQLSLSSIIAVIMVALVPPAFAQSSAIARAGRLECEASAKLRVQQQRDSGIDIILRETPLPPPQPLPRDEMAASCKAYILRTGSYHPACPCPL